MHAQISLPSNCPCFQLFLLTSPPLTSSNLLSLPLTIETFRHSAACPCRVQLVVISPFTRQATVRYDNGDTWTGPGHYIYTSVPVDKNAHACTNLPALKLSLLPAVPANLPSSHLL
mmetsp:Transcript_38938/g.64670  ORF Transcript_38938/g.64670 Transcript_38938/m.64670 type:complete len:116 (-) Transcript_38938:121-468(-)